MKNPVRLNFGAFIGLLCLLASLSGCFTGCASVQPGADALEVRAEQTVATAFNVFDTFLRLDDANRELAKAKAKAPKVHEFAEWLREAVPDNGQMVPRGLSLIQSANRVRRAYKSSRTPDNHASLQAALAALARAANEANTHLAALQTLKP